MARDRPQRKQEQGRRDLRVDALVRLDVAVAEVEEGLPADEAPRPACASTQVDRIRLTIAGGIEDHPEEWIAVVAGQIGAVGGAHHAVPEAVRPGLELDRNEAFAHSRLVEAAAVPQDVVHHRLSGDLRQELVDDEPVVVPRRQLPRLPKRRAAAVAVFTRPIDRSVVKADERTLQAGDHQVLVVPRIGDDRRVRHVSRGRSSNRPPSPIRSLSRSAGS